MNSQKRQNQRKRKNKVFKVEPEYITLAEVVKNSPYSQEYLSLLARQGKLRAKKFGRNWYITQTALDDYLTNQGIKIVLPKHLFNASYKGKITKALNFFPTGAMDFQKRPKAVLAREPIDLSKAFEGEPEKKVEPPSLPPEKLPEKETIKEEAPIPEIKKPEKEKKEEKVLEPALIRTMQKDIEALGGEPKKIPVKKKEEFRVPEKVVIPEKKEVPVIEKKEIPAVQPVLERKY